MTKPFLRTLITLSFIIAFAAVTGCSSSSGNGGSTADTTAPSIGTWIPEDHNDKN